MLLSKYVFIVTSRVFSGTDAINTWKLDIYFGYAGFIVGMTGNEAKAIAILPRGGRVLHQPCCQRSNSQ